MAASYKNRIVTLLILIILQAGVLSELLSGQEQIIDSLKNKLALADNISKINYMIELSELYFEISLKKSADYADSALLESRQTNYKKGEADALPYYNRALEIQEEINLSTGIAVSKLNLGDVYLKMGDHENANKYLYECLKISKKIGYRDVQSNCYELLAKYYKEKENFSEAYKYSQLIHTSAKNLYNLLNNLLQWTKAQTGKLDNRPEYLDINDPVNTVIAILSIAAREKKIKLISHIKKNHKVYCDKNLLLTILRNLIHNAIKYSKNGEKIEISTVVKNGFIEFSIVDNGIGISKTNLDNLFYIKHSFSTKVTNNEEGTGLGLILCKEFVDIMGGKIWTESIPETGTTIKFTVPNKNE